MLLALRLCLTSLLLLAAMTSFATSLAAAEWELERHEHGVKVNVDGDLFTEYLTDTGPKPILWPILLEGETRMTRDFPMLTVEGEKQDHPHQRSLWLTHGKVNGVDFWSEQDGHGTIKHRDYKQVEVIGDQAVIVTQNDWLAPDGKRVCTEERTMRFGLVGKHRFIDLDATFTASDGTLTFGDTKEGSLGIRVPTSMDVNSNQGGKIVNSDGLTDDAAWGKPARWVDYHGPVSGKTVGVAILNHPSSFRYPTTWHVRTYGLFAANPFGLHDFQGSGDGQHTVAAGETLSMRHRFVFHQGDAQQANIAAAFDAYAKEAR